MTKRHYILHMLSTITRKSLALSRISCRLLTKLSQLRMARTRESYRVARLCAAVITDSRLLALPVNSQSLRSAGTIKNPMSWVSVRFACSWSGFDHSRDTARRRSCRTFWLELPKSRWFGNRTLRSRSANKEPGKKPLVQAETSLKR